MNYLLPGRLYRFDTKLGLIYAPNLTISVGNDLGTYVVRTNKQGFRIDRDLDINKTKEKTILIFGDSYTAGDGVSNGRRFTDLLEKEFSGTEFLNLAVSGSSLDQNYIVFSDLKNRLKYDEVFLIIQVENILRLQSPTRLWSLSDETLIEIPKPTFYLSPEGDKLNYRPMKKYPTLIDRSMLSKTKDVGRYFIELYIPPLYRLLHRRAVRKSVVDYSDPRSNGWLLMKSIISLFMTDVGTSIRVIVLPLFEQVIGEVSYDCIRARFNELSLAAGIDVCHVYDSLSSLPLSLKKSLSFPADPHPTELCHKIYAEIIAAHLNKASSNQ
jgi:hypothetical protein